MAYDTQVLARARQKLESQRADKASQVRQRLQSAYAQVPRLRQIDSLLVKTMALAAQAALTPGQAGTDAMDQARQENQALQQERQALIEANFEPGYLDETPVCPKCGGSGYLGSTMCECLEALCREEQRKALSLLACGSASFEDFSLAYYSDSPDRKYGTSPRNIMEHTLRSCRSYAQQFSRKSGSLLFVGGTGLGKTMLSACIASAVVEKGHSVCYESASRLFSKLEKNRFSPDDETRAQIRQFESCDLLILDDLGTELPGNFVTAAFYSLLNDRLLDGKPMIISTNLTMEEIAQRYSPQIASRLRGSFQSFPFVGEDIRVQKSRGF